MGRYRRVSNSSQETITLGAELGKILSPGSVLLVFGDYGSGKTEFIRGVTLGYLGYTSAQEVASPSFSLLHVYGDESRRLCHYDFYRLENNNLEYVFHDTEEEDVLCIEWPNEIQIPKFREWLAVYITICTEFQRDISIEGSPMLLSKMLRK
ncbi:tRNA (adenosine(37)-N6)-threonylcarbamoyltransferase complex ATPase subunit type 1 TsaE [Candidatus Chlamydia sanziniae]|uniref:tRNA threonylcarbamoyladenosine biosynthesis protein TsaE n=1 Tax=Candidatus Chlamydia sanziniae TaxID=1806891 RepID=A0A1A9HTY8_9CHLA|nr:tRNA (adenosine(37)-N6)-threonylcarbamoyltransferase complex ATPase subunit type 1 TsaE [Candidatus Chlamydia sanziniae]ANH78458.1 TsaE protein [Candidatus Chlamydia sanziniae]